MSALAEFQRELLRQVQTAKAAQNQDANDPPPRLLGTREGLSHSDRELIAEFETGRLEALVSLESSDWENRLDRLQRRILAEHQQSGTLAIVALKLEDVRECHRRVLNEIMEAAAAGCLYMGGESWERHNRTILELGVYMPAGDEGRQPRPGDDSGDGPAKGPAGKFSDNGRQESKSRNEEICRYVQEAEEAGITNKWAHARDAWNNAHPDAPIPLGRPGRDQVRATYIRAQKQPVGRKS